MSEPTDAATAAAIPSHVPTQDEIDAAMATLAAAGQAAEASAPAPVPVATPAPAAPAAPAPAAPVTVYDLLDRLGHATFAGDDRVAFTAAVETARAAHS